MTNLPEKYADLIRGSVAAAAGIGVPGAFVPGIDVAAMAGIWTNMIIQIANKAGKPMSRDKAGKFVTAIASGVGGYVGGSLLFTKLLHAIPGVGTGAAIGINALLNGIYTYRLGKALISQFEKSHFDGDDLLNAATVIIPMLLPFPGPVEAKEVIVLIVG